MRSSDSKLLEYWIANPICKVEFAGFRSTTIELQNAGWQIAAEQMTLLQSMNPGVRLMLRHEGAGLYMLTQRCELDLYGLLRCGSTRLFMEEIQNLVFRVNHVARAFEVVRMPDTFDWFKPIDATPQYEGPLFGQHVESFNLFRPIDKSKEIIVDPDEVGSLMSRILELQAPKQKELREKARRASARPDSMSQYEPAYDIKAQIISLR